MVNSYKQHWENIFSIKTEDKVRVSFKMEFQTSTTLLLITKLAILNKN